MPEGIGESHVLKTYFTGVTLKCKFKSSYPRAFRPQDLSIGDLHAVRHTTSQETCPGASCRAMQAIRLENLLNNGVSVARPLF